MTQKTDLVLEETHNLARESSTLIREIQTADMVNTLSSTLEHSDEAMDEMKSLLGEGKSLIQEFKESPGDVLFKTKNKRGGPGE